MENVPFADDFPNKTSIYNGFSIAMLNYQRVFHPQVWHPADTNQLLVSFFGVFNAWADPWDLETGRVKPSMGWTDLRAKANTTRLKYVKPWVYHIQIYIYIQSYNHKAFWQGKTTAVNWSNMVYVCLCKWQYNLIDTPANKDWVGHIPPFCLGKLITLLSSVPLHPHVMVDPAFICTGKLPAYLRIIPDL